MKSELNLHCRFLCLETMFFFFQSSTNSSLVIYEAHLNCQFLTRIALHLSALTNLPICPSSSIYGHVWRLHIVSVFVLSMFHREFVPRRHSSLVTFIWIYGGPFINLALDGIVLFLFQNCCAQVLAITEIICIIDSA